MRTSLHRSLSKSRVSSPTVMAGCVVTIDEHNAEAALADAWATDTAHTSGKRFKKHLARFFQTAIPVCLFLLIYSTEAKAYTDPGSGAFLMQTALAIVAGGLFFAKSITARVRAFFRQDKTAKQKINADERS